MTSAAEHLRELVAIPSVSSQSNRPIVEHLQRFFENLGWHQRVLSYRDSSSTEKLNLIVSPQPLNPGTIAAELAIVCHTDTVPLSSPDATDLRELDGNLHGCGACDVKGFLSCMLAAASLLAPAQLVRPFCMVFTSDEEIGCKGARFLLDQNALRARYAIVGEPTSLQPAHAGKGYGLAEIHVHGRASHSAYPDAGRSAIFAAARLLREIEALAERLQSDRNEAFSPPWTTLNVGEISGGTAKNIVPAACSFLVEWRPIPSQPTDLVSQQLRKLADDFSTNGIRVEVNVTRSDCGFETPLDSPVIRSVLRQPDTPVLSVAFGTEAPWLTRMGAAAVVIGPGSMLTAHSPRECVPTHELDDCVRLLVAAIARLCA